MEKVVVNYEIEIGLSVFVSELVCKFQMTCLKGT
jgi:hypothetical protein